ncbi:MAG: hypothetical protein FWE64_04630 [Alphaproteobacteria bacterium]|nr:hypothetical protein [Alphaproteobacteria bacterium]
MRKFLCLVPCALCLYVFAPAHAGISIDFYGGAMMGAGPMWVVGDANGGQSFGAVIGADMPIVRGEIEYNFIRKSDTNAHIGMLNGYIKAPIPVVKPYIGVGIGQVFGGDSDIVNVRSAPAYQGMVGMQIDVPGAPLFLDLETRLLSAPRFAHGGHNLAHWDILRLKLRYQF